MNNKRYRSVGYIDALLNDIEEQKSLAQKKDKKWYHYIICC